ncbi:MAG: Rrf2 family transcriptional regulator [Candidatus Marinimicrobia bacterium]|nr:Rrf2 family transcriptional regulator [Candidatus Neomarinimicrobiota bacterium]MBT3632262.1 Rrf2 family transcriptional regulator [Candidatus Neomarinimicrobiota bacterium]MBT3825930.1 Rrf2 family transcriptional regulator [Candidatus Neomarinimicrobiota bacterium]MBT4129664.1 Rrf2 family transcriptional regulator [Candidatus Neomarinimicrobiota bacterium]MBT4294441.1 Rrf2 family transcriptional regulator [Candidatus Neomarinimicrobiota bacterium]
MIRLTKAGEYGLRAVRYLVENGDMSRISIGDISENKSIPEPFLRKLFKPLVQQGIINSTRGVSGGVRLARDPKEITVLEVVEALEGPLALNECLLEDVDCEFISECGMHDVWEEAQGAMARVLRSKNLTDLTR